MSEITTRDGCRIGYDETGCGPPLILIPGLGGAAAFWSTIAPLLADRFRVVAVDHRGAGRSDHPEGVYRIDGIASDTIEVMDALGIERADIVGHSTGGVVARSIAVDHPDRVRRLVVSGSWDRPDARFRQLFQARLDVLLHAGPSVYQRLTHALGFPAAWLEVEADRLDVAIDAAPAHLEPISVAAARIRMLLRDDRSGDLGRIGCPTLVIGATDDAIIPFYHSQRLAAAIGHAQLVATTGAHFFPRVDPAAFAATVGDFLKGAP